MVDTQQKKIDQAVRLMLYGNAPPLWFAVALMLTPVVLIIATLILVRYTYAGDGDKVTDSGMTYTPIVRVFMSTENKVIFFVQQVNGTIQAETVTADKIVWVPDVAAAAPMWAEWRRYHMSKNIGHRTEMVVHIHAVADVSGGSWDNGRFGQGTTTVVE